MVLEKSKGPVEGPELQKGGVQKKKRRSGQCKELHDLEILMDFWTKRDRRWTV